ncbi:MAG: hypothetical protein AUK37_01215 [Rhodobacterales bacterium CG2_30_65_12]|nr:MAG: hypothetical protein AUK37_01215 [Rhodobacterales bacterium CG2_30_65_12]
MAITASHTLPIHHHAPIARAFAALGDAIMRLAEARSRNGQFEQLKRLSDADLARLGLTRDGIARHVFADKLYL